MNLNEVAPPTKKHERMVKHIKKNYKKDGKLTDDEKSIAYATAWKNYNSESAVLDANTKISTDQKKKKMQAELKRLLKHAIAVKKGHAESFEIDKVAHKGAQKKAKMRNLAKDNSNPHEKAAAEKKAGGPKLYGEAKKLETNNVPKKEMKNINYRYKNLHKKDLTGTVGEEVSRRNKPSAVAKKKKLEKLLIDKEVNKIQKEEMTYQEAIDAGWEMTGEGIWWPPQDEPETVTEKLTFPKFRKKVAERKPEKAQDAGAKARRAMKRREHAKYVSGSEDNVPDDMRD